jgi:hypothetical protein
MMIMKDGMFIYEKRFKKIIFRCLLLILSSITNAIYYGYFKIFMDKYFFSPYKVLYLFGILNVFIFTVYCLISTYIPCNNNYYCFIEYNNKYYLDNIKNFFNNDSSLIIIFTLINIYSSFSDIFLIMIVQSYTLCHTFLPVKLLYFIYDIYQFKSLTIFNRKIVLIIEICYFTIDIFFTLVFLEIIELN